MHDEPFRQETGLFESQHSSACLSVPWFKIPWLVGAQTQIKSCGINAWFLTGGEVKAIPARIQPPALLRQGVQLVGAW